MLQRNMIEGLIIFAVLSLCSTVYSTETHTIETKYTWPRTLNRSHECELAKLKAKNKANSFKRNNRDIKVIKIDISDCDCKLGPDKAWGCRATATIEYEKLERNLGFKLDIKKLENYQHWLDSDASQISKNLAKINGMPAIDGVLSGFDQLAKYESSFGEMLKRVSKVQQVLNKIHNDANSVLEKTIAVAFYMVILGDFVSDYFANGQTWEGGSLKIDLKNKLRSVDRDDLVSKLKNRITEKIRAKKTISEST